MVLMALVLGFPFLTLQAGGVVVERSILTAGTALGAEGMPLLALLVILTSLACPLLVMAGVLYSVLPLQLGVVPPGLRRVLWCVQELRPWSLLPVFMLGVLIAVVKLMPMVHMIPEVAFFSLLALMLVYGALFARLDLPQLWDCLPAPRVRPEQWPATPVVRCHECTLLVAEGARECPRCGGHLRRRIAGSVQTTTALLLSAAILFVPANLLPVMTVTQLGRSHADTIISGVLSLAGAGLYGLAIIVVVASLVVPLAKLIVLALLLLSVHRRSAWRPRDRARLYRVVEAIGSWSMVDVYVVGLLTALVSLGPLGGVQPEAGIIYFAGVVILTMLAAHSFDPRLIWDHSGTSDTR